MTISSVKGDQLAEPKQYTIIEDEESENEVLTFLIHNCVCVYTYIYNKIEQPALSVTTIMALWQLVHLGTQCKNYKFKWCCNIGVRVEY